MTETPYPERTTKRQVRAIRPRQAAWVAVGVNAGATLNVIDAGCRTVYLCGPRPAEGWRAWAYTGLGERWDGDGHYLEAAAAPVLRYRSRLTGEPIELYAASQWFGDVGAADTALAASAWRYLGELVHRTFAGGTLLATPATTGRDLFLRTIQHGREWPVLSADTQELIREHSGQGRVEVLTPAAEELPGLVEYDGRLMYAALCAELPAGEPTRDTVPEFAGYQRGRYLVRVTVPRDWGERFGLLGVKDGPSGGWRYPRGAGEVFTTWVDGAELALALQAGWYCRILERLLFPPLRGTGPLDTWAAKLVRLRDAARAGGRPEGELVARAVRALLLHGIGAFQGRPHLVTHHLPLERAAEVPASAVAPRVDGDQVIWGEETGQRWAALAHPEWCAAVWARARVRLLRGPLGSGVLQRSAGEVVGFRTDAVYLTHRQGWEDDGRPGRLRLVRELDGAVWPWPTTNGELLALRRSMTEVGER